MLQSLDRMQHFALYIEWHGGRKALYIDFLGIQSHRLKKQLMARLIREAHDLILDGRAVARTDALDFAAVERRTVEVCADDLMRFRSRIGQMTYRAVIGRMVGLEGKRDNFILSLLHRKAFKVNRAAVDARRRAGLEALQTQSQTAQRLGERLCRRHTVRAGFTGIFSDDDAAAEEGARGDNDRLDCMAHADSGHDSRNRAVLLLDGNHLILHEKQVFLLLQNVLHIRSVFNSVGLRTQRMHRGALAAVEHTVLNAGRIRRPGHLSAQCIDLSNEVSLGRAADGRIARHIAYSVQIDRKTRGFRT